MEVVKTNTQAGYSFYLDGWRLPVTPGKLTTKVKGKNKTYDLVDGGEYNVLHGVGLSEFEFDMLLPMQDGYPFAFYPSGFELPDMYLRRLGKIASEKKPVAFDIVRVRYGTAGRAMTAKLLYNQSLRVSLESYTIKEDAAVGEDITVSVKLKAYTNYGTKIVRILGDGGTAVVETARETSNAPPSPKTYTVKDGDTLWGIAKYYTGDGARYTEIKAANHLTKTAVAVGQELILPW